MTHPGTPRDVDLDAWIEGIVSHPADTRAKQVAHHLSRELIANVGASFHEILPPGRDKALLFTHLEDALMRANRALALGGGPVDQSDDAVASMERAIAGSPMALPRDHQYEATQRGEVAEPAVVVEGVPASEAIEIITVRSATGRVTLYQLSRDSGKTLLLSVDEREGGVADLELTQPNEAEELASALLLGRNRAWVPPSQ